MKEDLLKIIKHYGVNAQQRQFAEEVFELQEDITQYQNKSSELESSSPKIVEPILTDFRIHIAEEIADVMVMLNQFKAYYDIPNETILVFMRGKINRQLERIKNEVHS